MQATQKVAEIDEQVSQAYSQGKEERPLGSYAALTATYNTVFAALLFLAYRTKRTLPERIGLADLLLFGVATHKLSRLITKEMVTSSIRAPFVEYEEPVGSGEITESPRGEGMRHAIGELLTCPFCIGQWIATSFIWGLVFVPRPTRLVAGIMSTVALSDFLQYGLEWTRKRAEE